MKKLIKRTLPAVLATSLVFSMGVGTADAKGPKNKNKHFIPPAFQMKDMKDHWAQSTVEKLSLLGVIKGYDDMTFQPNKPVTHAEAVVMTVRMLGWEDEAALYAGASLPFKDAKSIPSWARGSVAIALEKGLLESSHVFQANKAANRMYVTMLMVNAIGVEFNGDWEEARTYFSDLDELDEKERAALAFAVLQELVKGYEDGTFQPNKPVTRAEMAALLERAKERLDLEDDSDELRLDGEGEITAINYRDRTITFDVYSDNDTTGVRFDVVEEAKIYIDDKRAEFDDLDVGMEAEYVLNNDQEIIYIDAQSEKEVEIDGDYKGVVTKVENNGKIWVKVGLVELPFILSDDVEVYVGVNKGDVDDIEKGDKVVFDLDKEGYISTIFIVDEDEQNDDDQQQVDLGLLEDVSELEIEVEGKRLDLEYSFKQNDEGYRAKIEVKANKQKVEFTGKPALDGINQLLKNSKADLDENDIDLSVIADYIVDKYNLNDDEVEVKIELKIDGKKYEYKNELDNDDDDDDDDDRDDD